MDKLLWWCWIVGSLLLPLYGHSIKLGDSIQYLSYDDIVKGLHELQQEYPDIVGLYSAQEAFQLPHVGRCGVQQEPCTIWIVELVNRTKKSSQQLAQLPEMIVSGELHGDEPVGTLSSFYFIKTLVEQSFRDPWLSMLLNTRIVTVIPMTNAVGYDHNVRGESEGMVELMDPNRDFPFDQDPDKCMKTVAGKALYSLFHHHLFQILLTFHGGTNVLGYEWGDTRHCHSTSCEPSPDDWIMHSIATKLQQVSGSAGIHEKPYIVGDMGSTVYPVKGGLEDWAYGASWSDASGYCLWKNDSRATNISNRCIAYLIETSSKKHPSESTLGHYDWPMIRNDSHSIQDGHIPRNIRLSLIAMELLKPFIYLIGWGGESLWSETGRLDDPYLVEYVRMHMMDGTWNERRSWNKSLMDEFSLVWWVGGGLIVDETWIEFATAKEDSHSLQGSTMKQQHSSSPWLDPFSNHTLSGYLFHDTINLTRILLQVGQGHPIYFRGLLSMDRYFWNGKAQSHWIQARNNHSWWGSIPGHVIHGQSYFVSDYYRIEWTRNESVYEIRKMDGDQLQWNIDEIYPNLLFTSSTWLLESSHFWSWLKWVLLAILLGPGTFPLLGCIGVGCLRLCGVRTTRVPGNYILQRIRNYWISKRRRGNRLSSYYAMESQQQEEEGLWTEEAIK
ncbi:hypothetical protein GpartN1_g7539.t1 [Galdieria partita]|uniref:Peptidase M14 domain-containing protein n=1 Tax=Galdieria partita TaxID=83374 RepID=A0A9C7Q3B8_9RHOD|nr:hypothetical protein GpartN1_g7539.t1 [Galdieria partita]